MVADAFSHVRTWVFDLDNTLYPPATRLFDQIDQRMTVFVQRELGVDRAEADHLRKRYWREYGTTLAGLMSRHGIQPDSFLVEVHDIDFSVLVPNPALRDRIAALPGRRIVYTNGSAPYAGRVIDALGLDGLFDATYGIENAGFHPKPRAEAFDTVFAADRLDPRCAAMFEDDPRNLRVPHALGMRTVHVAPAPLPEADALHIHHHTDDLSGFLALL